MHVSAAKAVVYFMGGRPIPPENAGHPFYQARN